MMGVGDNSSGSWIFNWSMSDMTDSSNFDWKVEGFHALEMDIMGLKISIDNIFTMAVWADVAWRVYISTRLVIKYWFRSSEAIPALDMRRSTLQQGVMVTGTASMPVGAAPDHGITALRHRHQDLRPRRRRHRPRQKVPRL